MPRLPLARAAFLALIAALPANAYGWTKDAPTPVQAKASTAPVTWVYEGCAAYPVPASAEAGQSKPVALATTNAAAPTNTTATAKQ